MAKSKPKFSERETARINGDYYSSDTAEFRFQTYSVDGNLLRQVTEGVN